MAQSLFGILFNSATETASEAQSSRRAVAVPHMNHHVRLSVCPISISDKEKGVLTMSANSNRHQEIVKRLLDSKAVDFTAIGKTVAELGPSLAVADEPWEGFCGTMRRFIHVYQIFNPEVPVEELGGLAGVSGQLK
ncbi:MAG TPA: hypothetical protein VK699_05130 [Terriglobales bacterium]|jgi:hypothetical protein|nr:hypothetical protein [Terriglobales bacterium]